METHETGQSVVSTAPTMVDGEHSCGRAHFDDGIKGQLGRLNTLLHCLLVRNTLQAVAIHNAANDVNLVAAQLRDGVR